MIFATTHDSAARRSVVVGSEPLFEILSEERERDVRFRLSYRSGMAGGIMNYDKTGSLPVYEAVRLANMVTARTREDFETHIKGMNLAFWGKS